MAGGASAPGTGLSPKIWSSLNGNRITGWLSQGATHAKATRPDQIAALLYQVRTAERGRTAEQGRDQLDSTACHVSRDGRSGPARPGLYLAQDPYSGPRPTPGPN
jgi:hypothetical protein